MSRTTEEILLTEPARNLELAPAAAHVSTLAQESSGVGSRRRGKRFWSQGEPFVWASGAALAAVLALTLSLIHI